MRWRITEMVGQIERSEQIIIKSANISRNMRKFNIKANLIWNIRNLMADEIKTVYQKIKLYFILRCE